MLNQNLQKTFKSDPPHSTFFSRPLARPPFSGAALCGASCDRAFGGCAILEGTGNGEVKRMGGYFHISICEIRENSLIFYLSFMCYSRSGGSVGLSNMLEKSAKLTTLPLKILLNNFCQSCAALAIISADD